MEEKMEEKWFKRSFRRNLLDMHIPDWDEKFLSEFDPQKYVDMLALANVQSTMFYANSHVGHCYWPTKTGHMHKGLKGKDILGEVIDLCHQKGMDIIIYYSLIFNNWVYDNHSDWRIVTAEGKGGKGLRGNRYGVCCPNNSSYRDFVVAQIEELCKNYEFESVWPDMTFWPVVCYCPFCRKRYASEIEEKLPKIVNWGDPKWIKFQRERAKWLADFALLVTSTIKRLKPSCTVAHQANAFLWDWKVGASIDLAEASDFMAADFYGDSLQQSFFSKLFYNLSENVPFEFMTSRCPNLQDHTTTKSKELLEAQTYAALANGGAFLFVDAIDPVGTLDKKVYELMGQIFKGVEKYEEYLGGKPCQDVGIYWSFESMIDLAHNGKKVSEVENIFGQPPHSRAALGASKSLLNSHIPFSVITKRNLNDLSCYQIIVLPNMLMIDEEEAEALKDFVVSGGSLYVSKYTSLITKGGEKKEDFLLADLLGASYLGETKEEVTYICPVEQGKNILASYSVKHPLSIFSSQLKVKAKEETKVLATVTLPYTDPKDPTRFASIHSNPPGIPTEYPSILLSEYGKGKVLYVATDLEAIGEEAHGRVFINLIKLLSSKPFFFEVNAPKPVEVILFHQEDKKRYLINLVNFQKELPNIPVEGIKLRIRLDGKEPQRLIKLPEEKGLTYEMKKDHLEFTSPKLETFLMIALDYR